MADRIKIQLGLEIDTKTQKVNVNPKLIEQAVAAAMKNVNIAEQEIKTKLNVKPEVSSKRLRKSIRGQLKTLNNIIDDETGKFTDKAKKSALEAKRELDSIFALLAPSQGDRAFQTQRFKKLLAATKKDNFDLKELNKLADKDIALLNRYADRVEQQASRLKQVQARANKIAQLGVATGTASPLTQLDPSFLAGVGQSSKLLQSEARLLQDKLDVKKQTALDNKAKVSETRRIKAENTAQAKLQQEKLKQINQDVTNARVIKEKRDASVREILAKRLDSGRKEAAALKKAQADKLKTLNTQVQFARQEAKERAKARKAREANEKKAQENLIKENRAARAEQRLRDRLNAGRGLAREGRRDGFRNVQTVSQGRLAQDALTNRQQALQDRFARGRAAGLDASQLRLTTQAMKENERAMTALEKRMRSFSTVTERAGSLLRQFLRFAVGYQVLYQGVAAVQALARSLVELDTELKGIQAISGASADELNEIEGAIKNVALATRFTTAEIAKAARILAQSGVEPADIREVLSATADFAAATGSSLDQASDLLSTMRNVFKELDSLAISDKLTTAINISKLTAADLQPILSISAQIAKSYELTADQYLAAVTTLRNAGLKASTVATGLRQGIVEVFSPDSKTLKALKQRYAEIGEVLTDEAIKTRFAAFKGEANPLVAALNELNRLGFNDLGSRTFQRAFDIRAENAIRALIGNINELAEAQSKLSFGGSALLGSEIQLQSLSATVDNLGAAITVLADSLTDGAIPSLQAFLAEAVKTVQELTELNDSLKADTGTGLGTTLLAALGVGGIVFAKGKGNFLQRGAQAAAATGAVAIAGPTLTRGADAVGINAGDVVNAALTGAALASIVTTVVKFLGQRTALGRIAGGTASALGAGRAAVQSSAQKASTAKTVGNVTNAAALGIFLKDIFATAAGVFTKLKGAGGALKVAASLITKINPISAVISGLITVLLFANSFRGKQAKEIEKFNQRLQNVQGQAAEVAELQAQAEGTRFSDVETGPAAKGQEAAKVEEIEATFRRIDETIDRVLGIKVEEVQEILKGLAGAGASVGSGARNALLRELADKLEGTSREAVLELAGAQDVLSKDQVELSRTISDLAVSYNEASNSTEGLRARMFQQFQAIQDLGDEASVSQKKFAAEFGIALSGSRFQELIGSITAQPTDMLNILRQVMENTNLELNRVITAEQTKQKSELDKLVDQFLVTARGTDDRLEIQALLTNLTSAADKLGVGAADLFQTINDRIDTATKEIAKDTEGFFKLGIVGFKPDTKGGERLSLLRGDIDQSLAIKRAADAKAFLDAETKARQQVQNFQSTIDKATEFGLVNKFNEEIGPQLKTQIDDLLRTLISGGAFTAEGITTSQPLSNPEVISAIEKLGEKVAAEEGRRTGITSARTGAKAEIAGNVREAKIQSELNELGRQEVAAKRQGLEAEHQLFLRRNALAEELIQIQLENNQGEISRAEADAALQGGLQKLLVTRAQLLEQANELEKKNNSDETQARERMIKAMKLRALELERREIQRTPSGIGFAETDAFDRGLAVADAERKGISKQQQEDILISDFNKTFALASNVEDQIANIESQEIISAGEADKVAELKEELEGLNVALAVTGEELAQLNNTPFEEIKEGFDFQTIANGLENASTGVENLGENISGEIVGGLSNLGATLNDVARAGDNLGDTMKRVVASILSNIADLIANLIANKILISALNLFGPSPAAATGTANVDKLATGGMIRGPGTGTSDSIPGIILDKNGRPRKRILVSDGEAILNAAATAALGEQFINSLNTGEFSTFAAGGLIDRSSSTISSSESPANITANAAVAAANAPAPAIDNSLSIINVVDKSLVEDYNNSAAGRKTLINNITNSKETIKKVLR